MRPFERARRMCAARFGVPKVHFVCQRQKIKNEPASCGPTRVKHKNDRATPKTLFFSLDMDHDPYSTGQFFWGKVPAAQNTSPRHLFLGKIKHDPTTHPRALCRARRRLKFGSPPVGDFFMDTLGGVFDPSECP